MTPYGRREVREAVAYWQREFGFAEWTVRIKFRRMADRTTCEVMPEYKEMTLTFNLPAMHAHGDKLYPQVAHEFIHAPVWPLAAFAQLEVKRQRDPVKAKLFADLEEQVVTDVTAILLRLHPPPKDV